MIKIVTSLIAGSTAFILGTFVTLIWAGSSTYLRTDESVISGRSRSCQVKEVDQKGRVVWMRCDEWLRQNQ